VSSSSSSFICRCWNDHKSPSCVGLGSIQNNVQIAWSLFMPNLR
jgi:hypothetical protein